MFGLSLGLARAARRLGSRMRKPGSVVLAAGVVVFNAGLVLLPAAPAQAAGGPFDCSPAFYQVDSQSTPGQLKDLNPVTDTMTLIGSGAPTSINAVGYNSVDNYIYGVVQATGGGYNFGDLVRIDSAGAYTDLGSVGLTLSAATIAGDFDTSGHLIVQGDANGGGTAFTFYSIDVAAKTSTSFTVTGSQPVNDYVYISGTLYGVTPSGTLVSVDLSTDTQSAAVAITGMPTRSGPFGAGWSDSSGDLYFFDNATGKLYQIKNFTGASPSPTATYINTFAASSDNDGAACIKAASIFVTPTANPDSYTGTSGSTLSVNASNGVLANDTPSSGLTPSVQSGPMHGLLTLNSDGSFTYKPNTGFSGTDTFTYQDKDTYGRTSSDATVTLTIDPAAVNDTYATTAGSSLNVAAASGLLANDSGTSITISSHTAPAGTLTSFNSATGAFTYQPPSGWSGVDTFTYQDVDGNGLHSANATVTIDVSPVAVADSYIAHSGAALTVAAGSGVLANDVGTSLTVSNPGSVSASHGSLSLAADGSFTYTPSSTFSGTDSFTYTATDPSGLTGTATATFDVLPVANNDSYSTTANQTLTVAAASGVLVNDDGSSLTVDTSTVSPPAHGTVTPQSDGSFVYAPAHDFAGSDSFTYEAIDGSSQHTAAATVTISVGKPAPPVANNDSYSIPAGTSLTPTSVNGVLANDTGTELQASLNVGTPHGLLTLNGDGSFSYTPNTGFSGTDTFTYLASDPFGQSSGATVTITVTPVGNADTYSTAYHTPLTTDSTTGVLANDVGSALTATIKTGAHHGSLILNSDGSFTYTPNTGYAGVDSFTYVATDSSGQHTAPVTVSITVNPPAAPVANPDLYSTTVGNPISESPTYGVLANDTGTGVTAALTSGPNHGSLTTPLAADGSFAYQPAAGHSGADSFTYTITDVVGQTSTATVTIDVNPVANDDTATTNGGAPVTVSVLANDLGTGLSIDTTTPTASGGTVTVNAPGQTLTYTPPAGFSGTDSFTYSAIDSSSLVSNSATVTVTVDPLAVDDSYVAGYNTTLTIGAPGVLGNDIATGPHVTSNTTPAHGSLTLSPNGSFVYTPAHDYTGGDSFTYTMNDLTNTAPSTATVTLTVSPAVPVTVSGFVGEDKDRNGAFDSGEAATGVHVALLSGSTTLATSVTTATGAYSFAGVLPGTYTVSVDPTSVPAGTVQVAGPGAALDNTASVVVDGVPLTLTPFLYAGADLSVTGSVPQLVTPGVPASLLMTVHNAGPDSSAGPTTATYTPPSGVSVDASSLPSGCSMSGNTVSCALPQMSPGATDTYTLTILVPASAPAGPASAGQGAVGILTGDTITANNVAAITMQVADPPPTPAVPTTGAASGGMSLLAWAMMLTGLGLIAGGALGLRRR